MTKLTVEKVLEHHLLQNADQKLTPHLIAGLTILVAQNLRSAGLIKEQPVEEGTSP